MDLKYAVIGGGVAGTYVAWRLVTSGAGAGKTQLFEYSDRIGGRLYSKKLPGMPNIPAELGGMRFLPTSHLLVKSIVDKLGLPTQPFLMGNPAPVDPNDPDGPKIGQSRNMLFLRGTHLTNADLKDAAKVPYKLAADERGLSPTDLQIKVMKQLAGDRYNSLTTEEWCDVMAMGEPLYKIGYWNLLAQYLSSEAYHFMQDGGGYDANTANTNSVYQLPATEYGDVPVHYKCLADGYQSLPLTLEKQLKDHNGLPTQMQSALSHIERIKGGYRLTFKRTQDIDGHYQIPPDCETFQVEAEHVILAMPRRSLELVDWADFEADDWLRSNLKSVAIQKAFKLLLGFEEPWWRKLGLVAGRSTTDLPLRQTYYFPSEEDFSPDDGNKSAMLLATYSDMATVPFWRGLEHAAPFTGHDTPFTKGQSPVPATETPVTGQMVNAAVKQLGELHGLSDVPKPYTALYHDWSADPYGGGWHEWKAGYRFPDVIPKMLQPVDDEQVYICGEAYSTDQGWAEGSLATAETMLQKHLNLDRPSWIDADWKLGG
ncbi:FAD-dependent oxidoreductase [Marivita sp. S6314]|uniref:flavin monoamine oxidase family protein n=1 Tax=Marivita sp. S6314 TaxID=2926406 RepID=UPI001FF5DE9F|nr:FAD-dependent oxidoreductase [Marivita sp. S6314]MCK0150520.1 FAD-dependent oxidoreductase [Marivita sp. S6314]